MNLRLLRDKRRELFFDFYKKKFKKLFLTTYLARRAVSLATCLVFILTSTAPAQIPDSATVSSSRMAPLPKNLDVSTISIPENLGSVVDRYIGNQPDQLVIQIQDAHTSYDAQRNIQRIIDHVERHYGLGAVAFEGAEGELDPFIFRAFPDHATMDVILDRYIRLGELSGVDLAAAVNFYESRYLGIEDQDIYDAGIAAFLDAQKASAEALHALNRIEDALTAVQRRVYSPQLKEISERLRDYEYGRLDLGSLLMFLKQFGDPPKGSKLFQLFSVAADGAGKKQEAESLTNRLEAQEILREVRAWAGSVKGRFFKNEQEIKVDEAEKALYLLKDLAALQITPEQLDAYFSDKAAYSPERFQSFLREMDQDGDISFDVTAAVLFYRNAIVRDQVLANRLITLVADKKYKVAAFVSGGFHTPGITERLRTEGVSYVTVMPAMSDMNRENRYLDVMRGDISYSERFEKNSKGEVDLYKAFAEDVTERLAGKLAQRGTAATGLKEWRDSIIRSVVANGKAVDAHRYTYFIDRLIDAEIQQKVKSPRPSGNLEEVIEKLLRGFSGSTFSQYRRKVLSEFNELLNRMKSLDSTGALDVANFSKLLGLGNSSIAALASHPTRPGYFSLQGRRNDDWLTKIPERFEYAADQKQAVPVSYTPVDSKPVTDTGFGAITIESVSEDLEQLTLKLEQWRKIAQQNDLAEEANSKEKLDEKMKNVNTRRNVAFSHLNLSRKLLKGEDVDEKIQRDLSGALYHLEQAIDILRKEGLRIFRLRASTEAQEWIPLSWLEPNSDSMGWGYEEIGHLNSAEDIGKALVTADLQLVSSRQIPRVFRWSGPEDSTAMFRKREKWLTPRYLIKLGQHLSGLSNVATQIQIILGEASLDIQAPQENLRERLTTNMARLVNELDLFQLDFEQWSDVAFHNQFDKRILAKAFKRFRGVKQLVIKGQFARAIVEIKAIWQRLDAAAEVYRQEQAVFEVVVVPESERKHETNFSRYGMIQVSRVGEDGKGVIDSILIRNFSNLRDEIENIATSIAGLVELQKSLGGSGFGIGREVKSNVPVLMNAGVITATQNYVHAQLTSGAGFGAAFTRREFLAAGTVGLFCSACGRVVPISNQTTDQVDGGLNQPGELGNILNFEDVRDNAKRRALEPYMEMPFTSDPRFDPPASEQANDIGLVFEEANAIQRLTPNYASTGSQNYVVARVTTSADIGRFENVFISSRRSLPDDLEAVMFSPVAWSRSDYDYGNPVIQPPLPQQIPADYQSFSQINLGGRILNGTGFPVLFDINAIGYAHTASASAREATVFGTSLRWLLHFGTQGALADGRSEISEAFPRLRNIYIIPSANSQVTEAWMTFSTPAYEAVIRAKFYQRSPSFITVKGTLIPRRDISAREKVGIGGFSSFFGSNERYGDLYHDYDRIITIGESGERNVTAGFHPDQITLQSLRDRVDGEKAAHVFLEQNNRDPASYRRGANYHDRASIGIQFPKAMIGNLEIPLEPYFYTFPVSLERREYEDSTVVLFAVASDLKKGEPLDFEYTVQTYRSNPSLEPFDGTLPVSGNQEIPPSLVETLSGLTNALPFVGQMTGDALSAFASYDARPQGFYASEVNVPARGRRFAIIPVLNRSAAPSTFKIEMPGLLPETGVFLNKHEPSIPIPADGEWYLLAAEIEPDGFMKHFAVSDISAPFRQYGFFLADELPEGSNVIHLVPAGFGAAHTRRDFVFALAGSGLAAWAASAVSPDLVPLSATFGQAPVGRLVGRHRAVGAAARSPQQSQKQFQFSILPNTDLAARYREAAYDFLNRAKTTYEKSPGAFQRQFGASPSEITSEHYRRIAELYMFTEAHESGDGQYNGQVNNKGKVVGPGMSPASIEYQSIAELLSRHRVEFKELLGSEWARYQLQTHVLPTRYFDPSYLKKRTNAQISQIRAMIKAHGMEVGKLITDHLSLRIAFIHIHYFSRALARGLKDFNMLYPDSVRGITFRWARDYNGVAYHTMDEAGAQKWSPKTVEEKDVFRRRAAMVEQFEERGEAYRDRMSAGFYESYFSERRAPSPQAVYAEARVEFVDPRSSNETAIRGGTAAEITSDANVLSDMTRSFLGMSKFEWVTGLLGATASYIFSRRAYIAAFGDEKESGKGFGNEAEIDLDKLKQMIAHPKAWTEVAVHPRGSSTFIRTGSVAENAKVYPERDEALKRVRDEKISDLIPFLVEELKKARAKYSKPTHDAESYYYIRDLLETLVALGDPRLLPVLFDYLIDEHDDYRRDVRPYFEPQNLLNMGPEYAGAFVLRAAFTLRWHQQMSGGEKNLSGIQELLPLFSAEQVGVALTKGQTIELAKKEGRIVLVLPSLRAEDMKTGIPDNRAMVIIEKTKDGLYILGPESSAMSGVHLDLSWMGDPVHLSAHVSPFAFQDSPSATLKPQERFKKIKLEYVSYLPEQNIIIIGRGRKSGDHRRLVLGIDSQGEFLFTSLSRDHVEIEITPSNTVRIRNLSRNGTQIIYDIPSGLFNVESQSKRRSERGFGSGTGAGEGEKDLTNPLAVAEDMLRKHPKFIDMLPSKIVTGQVPLPDNPEDLMVLLFGSRGLIKAVQKAGAPEVTYEAFDRKVLTNIATRISKLLFSDPDYEEYFFTVLADRLMSDYRARGMDERKIEMIVYGLLPMFAVGEILMAMVQIAPEVSMKMDEEAIERAAKSAQEPPEMTPPQEPIRDVLATATAPVMQEPPAPAEDVEEKIKVKGDVWSKFELNRWRRHFTQARGENVTLILGDRSSFTLDFGRRKISYQQFFDTVAFGQSGEIWTIVFYDKKDVLDIPGLPIGGKYDILQIGMNLFQLIPGKENKSIELKSLTSTGSLTVPAKVIRKQKHTQYSVSLRNLAAVLNETLPEFSGFVRELVKSPGATGKGFGSSLSEPPDSRQLGEVFTTPGKSLLEPNDLWWRSNGFTTPGAFRLNGKVYLIVRGIDEQGVSRLGLAVSADGHSIEKIFEEPIFVPAGLEQGVENPRVTVLGDQIYMLYTARRGRDRFQLELASISKEDFLLGLHEGKWESKWRRHDIEFADKSRRDVNDRNAAIFPEKIGSEYIMYFRDEDLTRTRREIRIAYANKPDGPWDTGDDTSAVLTPELLEHRLTQKPESPIVWVGVGGPPLLTKDGWFTVFHYVDEDRIYRMGFFIADRNHPEKIIYLHDRPIWELGDAYYDLAKSHQLLAIPRAKIVATIVRRINRFQLSGFFGLVDAATFRRWKGHDVPVGDRYTLHVSGIVPEFEKKIIQPGDPILLYGGVFNTDTGLGILEYPELGDLIARASKTEESQTTVLSGKKILVIEDIPEIRDEIVRALKQIGKVEESGGQIFAPSTSRELQAILEQAHSRRLSFDVVISDHDIPKFSHVNIKRGTQVLKILRDPKGYIPPTIYYSNMQYLENLPRDEARTLAGVRRIMKEITGTKPLRFIVSPENLVRQDLPALLRARENLPAQTVTVSEERIVDIAYRLLGPGVEPKRKSLGQLGGEEFALQEIRLADYGSRYMNEEMLDRPFGGGLILVYANKPIGAGENLKEGDRVIFVHENNNVVRTGLYDAKSGQLNFVDRDVDHKLYFGPKTRILYRTAGVASDQDAGEAKGLLTEAQKKSIKDHFQDQKDPLDELSERILGMVRFVNVENDSDEFAPHLDIVKALFARTKDEALRSIDGLPHESERYMIDIAQKQGLDLTLPGMLDQLAFLIEQISFFPKAANRYVDLVTVASKQGEEAGKISQVRFTASRDRRIGDEHSEGEFEIHMKYKGKQLVHAPPLQTPYGFVEIGHSGLEFPVIFKEYVPGEDIEAVIKRLALRGIHTDEFNILLGLSDAIGAYVGNYYALTGAWPTDVAWKNLVVDSDEHPKGPFVARTVDLDEETVRDAYSDEGFFDLVSVTGDEFFEWAERQNNLRLNSFLPNLVGQIYLSMVKEMIRAKPDISPENKFEFARAFLNDLLKYLPAQAARGHREVIKDVLEKMRAGREKFLAADQPGAQEEPEAPPSKTDAAAGFGAEIFDKYQLSKDREEIFRQAIAVMQALPASLRPLGKGGKPGGLIFSSDTDRLFVVGDLHGRARPNLEIILRKIDYEKVLKNPRNKLAILGDAVHYGSYYLNHPNPAIPPLAEAKAAYLDSMLGLLMIADLIRRYPGQIFYFPGNHDYAHAPDNRGKKVLPAPFKNNEFQGEAFEEVVKEYFGPAKGTDLLNLYGEFVRALPLIGRFGPESIRSKGHLSVSVVHAGPSFAVPGLPPELRRPFEIGSRADMIDLLYYAFEVSEEEFGRDRVRQREVLDQIIGQLLASRNYGQSKPLMDMRDRFNAALEADLTLSGHTIPNDYAEEHGVEIIMDSLFGSVGNQQLILDSQNGTFAYMDLDLRQPKPEHLIELLDGNGQGDSALKFDFADSGFGSTKNFKQVLPIESLAPNVAALLDFNPAKVRGVLAEIQGKGFGFVRARLERELTDALNREEQSLRRRLSAEAGLKELAQKITRDSRPWTPEILRADLEGLGIVIDDTVLGDFALLVNRLRFALERFAVAETFEHYTLNKSDKREIEVRLDSMRSIDPRTFQKATEQVMEGLNSVLAEHRFSQHISLEGNLILGYEKNAAPGSREAFERFVLRAFGGESQRVRPGKLDYFYKGDRGVLNEISGSKQAGSLKADAARVNHILSLIDAHQIHGTITPATIKTHLEERGALVVSSLDLLEGGTAKNFPTGRVVIYPGRAFDESDVTLSFLSEKVDEVAKLISQGDQASNESLLRQIADYGFAFKPDGKGGQFIFVDRVAFVAGLELAFAAARQTAAAA